MTTITDLKNNRNEIIEFLTNELGSENVKEGMQIIASMIGFNGYSKYNVMEFVEAAIDDNGIKDRLIFSNGAKAQHRLEEINIEMSKRQKQSI